MTTTAKAIAGIGGLLVTATVPSTYLVISSSSSSTSGNSEEATKVDNRKAGTRWLTSSGYTPNNPSFKSQDSLRHGCSENLFSNNKGSFDPNKDKKLYGCAVMNMNLWNTEMRLHDTLDNRKDIDPKWIQFNSEIAIRKGNEGWIINSRFDNLSNSTQNFLGYMLTAYKYESNKWQKNGESKLWMDQEAMNGYSRFVGVSGRIMNTSDSKLVIKIPVGTWFENSDWAFHFDEEQTKVKKHMRVENWSGVWIDNEDQKSNSWIFQDIELYLDAKKYSQVFCKGEEGECFQSSTKSSQGSVRNPSEADTWSSVVKSNHNSGQVKDVIPTTVKEIMGKLQDSRGSWKKLESVCEVDGELDEKKQELLKMYCTNGKKSQ